MERTVGYVRSIQLLIIGLVLFSHSRAAAQERPTDSMATIYFNVVDPFGKSQPYQVTSFVSVKTKHDYGSSFKVLHAEELPYGEYLYKLQRTDYPDVGGIDGMLPVNHKEVWETKVYHGIFTLIQGRVAEALQAKPFGYLIHGRVQPQVWTEGPVWIRFQSMYEEVAYEARVDRNGDFQIDAYLRGNYVALVLERGTVIYLGNVVFRGASAQPGHLTIDVSEVVPRVTIVQ